MIKPTRYLEFIKELSEKNDYSKEQMKKAFTLLMEYENKVAYQDYLNEREKRFQKFASDFKLEDTKELFHIYSIMYL